MKKRLGALLLLCLFPFSLSIGAVGQLPTPSISGAKIRAEMAFDPVNSWYVYRYEISNPSTSPGEIWKMIISMENATGKSGYSSYNLKLPMGASQVTFDEEIADFQSLKPNIRGQVIPFGQNVPDGWAGGLQIDGYASFAQLKEGVNTIPPGTTLGGLELLSYLTPTIREAVLVPFWMYVSGDPDEVTPETMTAAGQIEHDIRLRVPTLAPSAVTPGSYAHWNQLRDDLALAIQLGWFMDSTFAATLTTQLASAREALDQQDLHFAHQRLSALLDTIANSTAAQRMAEGYGLVYFNVKKIIDSTNLRD